VEWPIGQRPWEADCGRVAALRRLIHRGSARKLETHHSGKLVERLTSRIVDGVSERLVVTPIADVNNLGVPSRGEEHNGRRNKLFKLDPGCHQVALHVVDAHERELTRPGCRFGKGMSHEERAHQAGACSGRNTVEVIGVNARIRKGFVSQGADRFDVGPGGHLRDDSTETGMKVDLRGEDIGERFGATNHRNRRLVATGLKREDRRIHVSRSAYSAESMSWAHMISASPSS